jgi:hypothetical protein
VQQVTINLSLYLVSFRGAFCFQQKVETAESFFRQPVDVPDRLGFVGLA